MSSSENNQETSDKPASASDFPWHFDADDELPMDHPDWKRPESDVSSAVTAAQEAKRKEPEAGSSVIGP
jgi:hypothetical protein